MITFIVVGIVGLSLLALSTLFGEILDLADGAVSGTGIGSGLTVFGAVGLLTYNGDGSLLWPVVWSAVAGLAMMAIVQFSITRLRKLDDGGPKSIIGVQGIATTDISPSRGEVSLDDPSELERRMAWANSPIAEGTRVVVREQVGSRVRVEPIGAAGSPNQSFAPPTDA